MDRVKGGMFVSTLDIQILTGCAPSTARREHQAVRVALGKKNGRISISEYAKYYGLKVEEVAIFLHHNR